MVHTLWTLDHRQANHFTVQVVGRAQHELTASETHKQCLWNGNAMHTVRRRRICSAPPNCSRGGVVGIRRFPTYQNQAFSAFLACIPMLLPIFEVFVTKQLKLVKQADRFKIQSFLRWTVQYALNVRFRPMPALLKWRSRPLSSPLNRFPHKMDP
jgi:hypothetical protein